METIAYNSGYGMDLFCHVPNGTCRLTVYDTCPSVMFLSTLIVNEKCRKQGIGTAILEEVDKIAQETGCDVISLQVENDTWMKDWYLRKGFIPVADGYDSNNVIMSKFIDSTKGEDRNMKNVCWDLINIIDGARKGDVDLILHRAKNLLQDENIDWYKTTDEILKAMKR